MEMKSHELHAFMKQISSEMSDEYNRIRSRATEDPGTAGDEGEENWAEVFRDWLPSNYHVVTKGRILSELGEASPQIDVLILRPNYPRKLLGKKYYLAAGVIAAFECKLTLKGAHIDEAIRTSKIVKKLTAKRVGTPYGEMHAPIVYGLIAHSHSWKRERRAVNELVEKRILDADLKYIDNFRYCIDVVCVSDIGCWITTKVPFDSPEHYANNGIIVEETETSAITSITGITLDTEQQPEFITPIGSLVTYVLHLMAWEDSSLRGVSDYFRLTGLTGLGIGHIRRWPLSTFSKKVESRLRAGELEDANEWSNWSRWF